MHCRGTSLSLLLAKSAPEPCAMHVLSLHDGLSYHLLSALQLRTTAQACKTWSQDVRCDLRDLANT